MSDRTETLAAILAEMRGNEFDDPHLDADGIIGARRLARDWADRIEAAVARERDEDRQLAAIAESDEAFARCARCDRPERAPGNAAALREALERAIDAIDAMVALYDEEHTAAVKVGATWKRDDTSAVNAIVAKARSALAAPPRNCDVGDAAEQGERLAKFCKANFEKAKKDKHICSECRFNDCPGECQLEWAQLPFAPGKGGAE